MLIYINPERSIVRHLQGRAHIVISLDQSGDIQSADTFCFDASDSSLSKKSDAVLLGECLPFLLEELRQQIALGRRLTAEESASISAKRFQSVLSGSTVTE